MASLVLGLYALHAWRDKSLQAIGALVLTVPRFAGSNTQGTWLQKAHGLGQLQRADPALEHALWPPSSAALPCTLPMQVKHAEQCHADPTGAQCAKS